MRLCEKNTRQKVALYRRNPRDGHNEHEYEPHSSNNHITASTLHSDFRGWGTRGFSGYKVTFCLVFPLWRVQFAL